MTTGPRQIVVALDGTAVGQLEATDRAYQFSYFASYEQSSTAIPISLSYPLGKGPWIYGFGGELPPYFYHLLPEGWLKDIAEQAHLPMNTPLEKLVTLCRENTGAVEIYQNEVWAEHSKKKAEVATRKTAAESAKELFHTGDGPADYPQLSHCLRCQELLDQIGYNANYHDNCALEFFGTSKPPFLQVDPEQLQKIAADQLKQHESLTGVQPKFSALFKDRRNAMQSIGYIVKPEPTFTRVKDGVSYKGSTLTELIAMHFAEHLELEVAETALLYLNGGQPALISKRFDRIGNKKVHTEDFAQVLSIRDKYKGSHEQIAKHLKINANLELSKRDLERFYKVILFNFIIGNADGHLKNYSLIHNNVGQGPAYSLAPFYDLMPVRLFAALDEDQLALTVDAKKRKLQRRQFVNLAIKFELNIQILDGFIEEFELHLGYYYDGFKNFKVSEELLTAQRDYIEQQLKLLKNS